MCFNLSLQKQRLRMMICLDKLNFSFNFRHQKTDLKIKYAFNHKRSGLDQTSIKNERKILGLCLLISETETAQRAPPQDHQHRHVPVPRQGHHEGQKIYQNKAQEWRKIRTNEVKSAKFFDRENADFIDSGEKFIFKCFH